MKFRNLIFLFSFLVISSVFLSAVEIGDSYDMVISELGNPDGNFEMGGTKILTYGEGKIKIKKDKVIWISPNFTAKQKAGDARKEEIEAKRQAGLVPFRGRWMRPEEKQQILAREDQRRRQNSRINRAVDASRVWTTDYQGALTKGRAENKLILLDFTGSDWCSWCIKLDREVFSQPEFISYAGQNLVMVRVDFPRKRKLSAALTQQNKELASKYRIRAYPTIVVLDNSGKVVGRLGYVKGGPKAFISALNSL